LLQDRILDEGCKRNYEVNYRKHDGAAFVAAQNAIFSRYWREDEELDNTTAEAVEREESADAAGGKVKAAGEL
jgi:hypothetical protein